MDDTIKTNGLAMLDAKLGDVLCELFSAGAYEPVDIGNTVGERLVLLIGPEGQDVQLAFFAGFVRAMPEEMLARLFVQFPLTEAYGRTAGRSNRKLAIALADELGPALAQALYRLSVLVTKLA